MADYAIPPHTHGGPGDGGSLDVGGGGPEVVAESSITVDSFFYEENTGVTDTSLYIEAVLKFDDVSQLSSSTALVEGDPGGTHLSNNMNYSLNWDLAKAQWVLAIVPDETPVDISYKIVSY